MRDDISRAETLLRVETGRSDGAGLVHCLAALGSAALLSVCVVIAAHNVGPRMAFWRANLYGEVLGLAPRVLTAYFVGLEAAAASCFLLVAILLASRHWRDRSALFVAVALATYGLTISQLRDADRAPPWLELGDAVQVVGTWSILMLFFVFPDGRFHPRWARYAAVAWSLVVLAWYLFPELPLNLHHAASFNRTFFASTLFTAAWIALGLYCQWVRYRALEDRVHRQQIKWVLFGFTVAMLTSSFFFVINGTIRALGYPLDYNHAFRAIAYPLMLFGHLAIPASIGLAVERLRLFDVDRVLHRTMAYLMVTGVLGLSYLLVVLWAQTLLQQFLGTETLPLFVAFSTLALAALFLPLYRRVQRLVDRELRPSGSGARSSELEDRNLSSLGDYELLERVGSGGMASVFRARRRGSQEDVAVKVLLERHRGSAEVESRFRREASVVARLDHPAIVRLVDHGRSGERLYLVMEFIRGPDLARVLDEEGRCDPARVMPWIQAVAEALDYAHQQGVVHRDLKPSNVMLRDVHDRGAGSRAVLTDFGLARVLDAGAQLTATMAVGTVHYMSPEQIRSPSTVGPPSDIYALGALTYHLLSGSPPFAAENAGAVLMSHLRAQPPDIRAAVPELSPQTSQVLARALAKSPERRPGSATEFVRALGLAAGVPASPASGC
jgi:tRNA A-37 threonylcarbamoyl transferase component Bud32